MNGNFTFKNIGILFTIYSVIYVYVYYGLYGINIFYYTDLQGVLTLFLSNLVKILFFGSSALVISSLVSKKDVAYKNKTFNNVSLKYTISILVALFIIFILLFAELLSGTSTPIHEFSLPLTFLVGIGAIHAMDRLDRFIYFKFKLRAVTLKTYFLVLFIMPYFMCQLIVSEVNYYPKKDHIYFCYNDTMSVETGKKFNLFLIGKTNDNIFIYDKSKNRTLVFDLSNVKDFKIYDVPAMSFLTKGGAVIPNKGL
ncbi:hypothetical protein SGQ83_01295 [Flavobacterium sp. Fl-318]|uniref:Uncharacterized protein n=1 Tax=Flavobacterium cupriresistens TaxID=2893885 RepID=A0ABU4R5V1_9FLAO|nr:MULTISPECIES: hypothetical protein [unclassified Flavobacterium]MDX6187970.1 hypothetical protein [Flavobacterium sp. Fl-318]UFH42110.1 hypothetical protein LNP23_20155 [Flavobacterium sp. F-323]